MGLDDTFGRFPGRPDHPDLARLSELIIELDRLSQTTGFNYREHLGQFCDTASITYMAQQRAMRIASGGLPVTSPMDALVAMAGAAFLDGFVLGCQFRDGQEVEG